MVSDDLLRHIATLRDAEGEPDDVAMLALADRVQEEGDEERASLIRVSVNIASLGKPPVVLDNCIPSRRYGPGYFAVTGGEETVGGGRLIMEVKVGDRVDINNPRRKPLHQLRVKAITDDEVILVRDEKSVPFPYRKFDKLRAEQITLAKKLFSGRDSMSVFLAEGFCHQFHRGWSEFYSSREVFFSPHGDLMSPFVTVMKGRHGPWIRVAEYTGSQPREYTPNEWFWYSGGNPNVRLGLASRVPRKLWEEIRLPTTGGYCKVSRTREEAVATLATAVPRWARKKLGLT